MKKYGIKNTYVDTENYLQRINEDFYKIDSFTYETADPIRYYSKNFWTKINGRLSLGTNIKGIDPLITIEYKDDSTIVLHANKKYFTKQKLNERGLIEPIFDEKAWETFVDSIIPPNFGYLSDLYFDTFNPFVDEAKEKTSLDKNENYLKSNFVFNFFHQKYEQLSSSPTFQNLVIPDAFTFFSDTKIDNRTFDENLKISLGGLIENTYSDALMLTKDINNSVHEYFDRFSEKYSELLTTPALNEIVEDNLVITVDKNINHYLKNANFIPFPYYVDIKFSNPSRDLNNFIHKMDENGHIQEDLLRRLMNEENVEQNIYLSQIGEAETKPINHYDFKEFIRTKMSGTLNLGTADGVRIMEQGDRIYHQVEYTKLIKYMKDNIKPKTRKYHEIFNKPCHTEVLFLKIDKKQFGFDRQTQQTFWVKPDDSDYMRIIDTQLKYGTDYYYDIHAYVFVLGNSYRYSLYNYSGNGLEKINDIKNGIFKIKIENKSLYKIFEVPYGRIKGNISEYPVTKPQLSIKKDQNNVRISLMQPELDSLEEFEILESRDFDIFQKISMSQGREDNKLHSKIYNSDGVYLEIYKTINKPTNYLSFQNKLYKTVLLKQENSFIESLIPNIKYYYTFRYLNNHGIPSNASDIFELEMKDEEGYMYLNVNKVDLKRKLEKSRFKNLKRYLLIRPSVIQTQPIFKEVYGSVENVELGPGQDPVWNKDFILRIISKKSNKVLEFNLKSRIFRKKD